MTGPRPDPAKAARYDALRRSGKSHEQAVAEIEASPAPADGPPTESPDRPGGVGRFVGWLARTGAQGATLGFSDELRGLAQGVGALIPGGRSPREAYRSGRDAEREALGEFRQDFPKSALAAEMLGGIVTPGLGFGASVARGGARMGLGQVVKQGAKVGGLTGAIYGAGTGDEGLGDRLSGAATGGAAGTVLGAALPLAVAGGSRAVRSAAERVGRSSAAPQRVQAWAQGSRTARDVDAGAETVLRKLQQDKVTPEDLVARTAEARAAGISDVAIPDMAGANTRGLIDLAAVRPGPAQETVRRFAETRDGGMREMLADAFETVSRIPRRMVRGVREELLATRKEKANKLFEGAFNEAGFMDDPRLIAAIEQVEEASPRFQTKALELARLHKVPPGQLVSEARVPPQLAAENVRRAAGPGMPFDRTDEAFSAFQESIAGARRVPSLRYAHYLKEALDEEIARAQQLVGNGGSGSRLSGLMQLKDQLRTAAVEASPRYGQALQEFAGDSEMLRALALGERVLHSNVAPDELAATVARMTPGEQQMFRISGLNAMRNFLQSNNAALAPGQANAWWNSPQMRTKMELLLGSEDQTATFLKAVGLTREKALTGRAGLGSQTAARGMADEELGEVMGLNRGEGASVLRGGLTGLLQAGLRHGTAALKANRLNQAAPYLTATGPDLDRRLLELALLMNRQGTKAAGRVPQQAAGGVAVPLLREKNP